MIVNSKTFLRTYEGTLDDSLQQKNLVVLLLLLLRHLN